ncbi:MAG: RidA family protein [Gemmatimonadaceae bacterium]
MTDTPLPATVHVAEWPTPQGFANGMSGRGRLVVTAGVVGWNPMTGLFESDDLSQQVGQVLRNIVRVLETSGAEPRHLVRLTWYLTNRDEYIASRMAIGEQYRAVLGRHFPAMAVVFVSSLLEARAKVEIEATAIVPET